MLDVYLLVCYSLVALACLFILLRIFWQDRKKALAPHLAFLGFSLLGWAVSLICYILTTDAARAAYLHDFKLPFVALSAFATYLFVMRFYGMKAFYTTAMNLMMIVIPFFTTVLVLTSPYHNFIRLHIEVTQTWPNHQVDAPAFLWFWVHSLYCYALLTFGVGASLWQHRRVPRQYYKAAYMLLAGVAVSAVSVFSRFFGVTGSLDVSLLGACACFALLYWSSRNYQGLDYLIQARSEVFTELDEAILILDNAGQVVYRNRSAAALLEKYGVSAEEDAYTNILHRMFWDAEQERMPNEEYKSVDFISTAAGGAITGICNVQEKPIFDRQNRQAGMSVRFSDVTKSRAILYRLEKEAGMDALTGVLNRGRIRQIQDEMEMDDLCPVAVLLADLNGLKQVNDQLGHGQGDIYLRTVADVFIAHCPPNAHIGRVGGDEFVILMDGSSRGQAEALAAAMAEAVANTAHALFTPSVSMGIAVRAQPGIPLRQVVAEADRNMYENKRKWKAENTGPIVKSFVK